MMKNTEQDWLDGVINKMLKKMEWVSEKSRYKILARAINGGPMAFRVGDF